MSHPPPRASGLGLVSVDAHAPQDDVRVDFDALYERFAPYVASIGLRLLGRPDEVDDLIQEVFFTAHRKMHQLKERDAVKSWLATIAVRQAHRRLRARRMWSFVGLDTWDAFHTIPDPGASPQTRAEVIALFRALETLPPALRIAWTLKHLEGERLDAIALLCDCSTRTIKRRIRQAQELLEEVWHD
ncbi:MAG: hypothetical protein CMH57_15790 [Myxococcales bacterium]|nr:hypothetical protein [Myxococcales bacterium]